MSRRWLLIAGTAALGSLASYFFFSFQARVDDTWIWREEVELRNAINRIQEPEDKRSLGLFHLIRAYQNVAILKKFGVPVTPALLSEERERIERSTQNPDQLRLIQNLFARKPELYDKVFVLPVWANQKIYFDFYFQNDRIHVGTQKKAQALIEASQKKPAGTFYIEAKAQGFDVKRLKISARDGITWPKIEPPSPKYAKKAKQPPSPESRPEATAWSWQILRLLKEGEVAPLPINRGEAWLVLRLDRAFNRSEDQFSYVVDVALVPKRSFSEWLEEERRRVSVFSFLNWAKV